MINRLAGLADDRQQPRAWKTAHCGQRATAADLKQLLESAEQVIVTYPAASLAGAFFAGVVIAWWIKRN